MTWYTFFKSVHVLCAVVWVGGALTLQVLSVRALRGDGRRQVDFANDAEFVGMRIFLPTTIVLLLSGIAATINGSWDWGYNWITFGLLVFIASFVTGAGFIGPESGRIAKLIEAEGPESVRVGPRIRRILLISRVELVFLAAVVWNMVVKPVGQPGWFWGAVAVTVALALGVVATGRRGAAMPSAAAAAE